MTERHVSTGEAAKATGIGHRSLRRWAEAGTLKPAVITPGGHYLWDLDDLRRQLKMKRPRDADS